MSEPDFDALEREFQASQKPAGEPDFDALEAKFQESKKPNDLQHTFDFPEPWQKMGEELYGQGKAVLQEHARVISDLAAAPGQAAAAGLVGLTHLAKGEGLAKAGERTEEALKPGYEPAPGEGIPAAAGKFAGDTVLLGAAGAPLSLAARGGAEAAVPAARAAAGALAGPAGQSAVDLAAKVAPGVIERYGGAAAAGATVNAAYSTLEQMAKRGEVSPQDVQDSMLPGAVAGMAFQGAHDAVATALQARSSGALDRVLGALKNRADYEINRTVYYAKKGLGLPNDQGIIPYDVKANLARAQTAFDQAQAGTDGYKAAQIALKQATMLASEYADEGRLKQQLIEERGLRQDPAAKLDALLPEVDMLVKSGLPADVAAKQVLAAAAAIEHPPEPTAPLPAAQTVVPAAAEAPPAASPQPAAAQPPVSTPPAAQNEAPAASAAPNEPAAPPPAAPAPAGPPAAPQAKLEKPVAKVDKPLKALQNVINRKSKLPILSNVHVKDGVATTTDLEVSAQIKLPDAPKDGIYKFVGQNLEPEHGDPADFPLLPKTPHAAGEVNRNEFLHELERTAAASSTDGTRQVLNSVALDVQGGKVTMVATDGRRLSLNGIGGKGLPDGQYVIGQPAKVLKVLKGVEGDSLKLGIDQQSNPRYLSFTGGNGTVTARLIESNFPNYRQVLPRPTEQIQVDAEQIRGALAELKPYIKTLKGGPMAGIHLDAKPDSLTISVKSDPPKAITLPAVYRKANYPAISEGSILMPMRGYEGTAHLNPEFLADALEGVRGKTAYIGVRGEGNPALHVYGKDLSIETAPPISSAQAVSAAVNPKPKRKKPAKDLPATDSPGKQPSHQQMQEQAVYDKTEPMDARSWQVNMPREPAGPVPAENVNKLKIIHYIEKEFGVPVRSKTLARMGKATAGHYEVNAQLIRLKRWGELEVLFHEMFHHLDETLKAKFGQRWKGEVVKQLAPNLRNKAFEELRKLDYDQNQQRVHEGLAEYGRLLISVPAEVQVRAPLWHDAFTKWQAKNQPDLTGKLAGVKERYDLYRDLGSEGRILSQIDFKGELKRSSTLGEKFDKAADWVKEKLFDEFAPIEKIQKELGVAERRPTRNAFKMATYVKQKASGIARTFVEKAAVDEYGNVVGPSLSEVLKPIQPQDMKSFIAYGTAKRALLLSGRGIESGFDLGDATYVVDKLGKAHPEWAKVADDVTKWADHGLDWLVRAGGLGPNEAEVIREINPVYMTFKRVFIDELDRGPGGMGSGKMASPTMVHKLKGSGRPIVNPIEAMVGQMANMIARSHKVRVASLIADWAKIKGAGKYIAQLPPPVVSETMSLEQIKNQLRAMGVDLTGVDMDQILTVFHQSGVYRGKDNVVSIWKGGQRRFYELHPDLYRALQGVDDLRIDNKIIKFMAAFARLKRLGATGINAGFGLLKNPIRDLMTYKVFSRRAKTTIFDTAMGAYKDITAEPGDNAFKFKAAGGELSSQLGYDRAATMAAYDEMLTEKLPHGKILKVVKHPIDALRRMMQVWEMGPRIAELEGTLGKIREAHPEWSDDDVFVEAFNNAQDVTVNFTRSGSWSKKYNQVSAFFNANMQGLSKITRAAQEDPLGTATRGVLYLSSLAIGSWIANKDKQWYKNLDPAYKYNNLFFEVGGEVFRLPIPFELGTIFIGTPIAALDQLESENPKELSGLLANYANFLPNQLPSVFGPAIDVLHNKDFLGRPIESEGMKYLPQSHRMNYHTSAIARALGPAVEAIGIPLSPVQMDYMFYNYTGGLPKQFRLFGGKELADLPIIGDVIVRAPEKPARQINEMFMELKDLRERRAVKELEPGEPARLAMLEDVFRSTYKPYQDRINRLQESGDADAVREQYAKLQQALSKRGID